MTTVARLYEHIEHLGADLPAAVVVQLQDEAAAVAALAGGGRVSLRRWYDDWPLPPEVAAMVAETRRLCAELAAAVARSRAARGADDIEPSGGAS